MRRAKVAILEEDSVQRDLIRALLTAMPNIEVVAPHGTRKPTPSIIFVNVHLAQRNESILRSEDDAAIIALADSPEAALEAFNLRAIDCLLKPVRATGLTRAMQRAFDYLELREPKATRPKAPRNERKYLRQLRVRKNDAVLFLPAEQVLWIEAQDNYVRIHTHDQIFMERGRISSFETTLDPDQFLRVNRSAIVNIRQIAELRSMFKGAYSVILRNGARISMARSIEKLERLMINDSPASRGHANEPASAEFA